jgi:hypothetical protein
MGTILLDERIFFTANRHSFISENSINKTFKTTASRIPGRFSVSLASFGKIRAFPKFTVGRKIQQLKSLF